MRFSFYKYILVFFFLFSCTTIDELHGIDNLKIKSESLEVNTNNTNDVLNLIGPPQNIGLTNNNIWFYHEVRQTRNKYGTKVITDNNTLRLEFDDLGVLKKINFLDKNTLTKNPFDESTTISLGKDSDFLSSFLASMRQRAKNFGKSNEQ
jgi:outer membrane protein assembly factor BamE (lipoprotein component of BamABCDE complex)